MGGQPLTSLSQAVFAPKRGVPACVDQYCPGPKGNPKGQPLLGENTLARRLAGGYITHSLVHSSQDGPPDARGPLEVLVGLFWDWIA